MIRTIVIAVAITLAGCQQNSEDPAPDEMAVLPNSNVVRVWAEDDYRRVEVRRADGTQRISGILKNTGGWTTVTICEMYACDAYVMDDARRTAPDEAFLASRELETALSFVT